MPVKLFTVRPPLKYDLSWASPTHSWWWPWVSYPFRMALIVMIINGNMSWLKCRAWHLVSVQWLLPTIIIFEMINTHLYCTINFKLYNHIHFPCYYMVQLNLMFLKKQVYWDIIHMSLWIWFKWQHNSWLSILYSPIVRHSYYFQFFSIVTNNNCSEYLYKEGISYI